jgi:hypothetical protein
MSGGIEVRKFVVSSDAGSALLHAGAWQRHPEMRDCMTDVIHDTAAPALAAAADKIRQAEDESPFGCKVPCDEHSRCVGFNPQVWNVRMTVRPVKGNGNG